MVKSILKKLETVAINNHNNRDNKIIKKCIIELYTYNGNGLI